jgi:hypothetical protein
MEQNVRGREFEPRIDVSKVSSKALPQRARKTQRFSQKKLKSINHKGHEGSRSQCFETNDGFVIFGARLSGRLQ